MSAVATPKLVPPEGTILVIPDADWRLYVGLGRILDGPRRLRLTYDRGILEIMSPLIGHDNPGELLGSFVSAAAEELRLPITFGGSTTLRRRKRGIEPDKCYWIKNAAAVSGLNRLDLRKHPPPDLAIEVDVTRSSVNRMGIYANLEVPEVWRLSRTLSFQLLNDAGLYVPSGHSLSFPQITPGDVERFLAMRGTALDGEIVRQFRDWVRSLPPMTP